MGQRWRCGRRWAPVGLIAVVEIPGARWALAWRALDPWEAENGLWVFLAAALQLSGGAAIWR